MGEHADRARNPLLRSPAHLVTYSEPARERLLAFMFERLDIYQKAVDFDDDNDADFGVSRRCFRGANVAADPACGI